MVAVAGILMLAAARIAFQNHDVTYFTLDRGLLFPSANTWIAGHWLTMVVNTALLLGVALAWMLLVQIFNPFRALTTLSASFFLIMMLSAPDLVDQFYTGTLLAASVPVCLGLLWSSFADIHRLRHIFLIFCILSALTMTQYCFIIYIAVYIIGCVQMKIFSLRTVLAIVMGLVTPWWIVFGFGLASPDDLHWSDSAASSSFTIDETINILLVTVTTIVVFFASWAVNLVSVIKLNANMRAYNGSISIMSGFTIIALLADFTNAATYLPTLMLLTSFQLSYLFGRSNNPRRFIPILALMALYVVFYALRIFT